MKTGTKALVAMMIVAGALAISVFAQPAFADTITAGEQTRDRDRVRDCIQTCNGDGNCNCNYAYQHRYGECSGNESRTQARSRTQFRNSYQYEEMSMERQRFGRG